MAENPPFIFKSFLSIKGTPVLSLKSLEKAWSNKFNIACLGVVSVPSIKLVSLRIFISSSFNCWFLKNSSKINFNLESLLDSSNLPQSLEYKFSISNSTSLRFLVEWLLFIISSIWSET